MLWWSVPNNVGLLGLDFLEWEVQEVVIDVPDGVLVLLWHQTTLILAQPRRVLSSWALSLKFEQDFLLLRMYVSSLLSYLTSQNFLTLSSYLSSLIYIPLSMRSLWWKDIPYVSESLLSYHWLEGIHFLLWTWSPSKSNLMLVIAGQADSPNKLSLNHNMS